MLRSGGESISFRCNWIEASSTPEPPERSIVALVQYTARESPDAAARLGPRFDQVGFLEYWETCAFPRVLTR
jgi:hypothetical protein